MSKLTPKRIPENAKAEAALAFNVVYHDYGWSECAYKAAAIAAKADVEIARLKCEFGEAVNYIHTLESEIASLQTDSEVLF